MTSVAVPVIPKAPVDERLSKVSFLTKLLQRPELGALLGAAVVLLFFVITADRFGTLSGMARWTDVSSTLGIMAVAVALLMIGGEFDLSAGVMTGTSGLLMGILATRSSPPAVGRAAAPGVAPMVPPALNERGSPPPSRGGLPPGSS